MESMAGLALGFSHALTLPNLGWALLGCFLGTAIGVLPGIGPALTILTAWSIMQACARLRALKGGKQL